MHTARSRFLAAARRQPTDRAPVWLMRQAGRYLPEYRELKARHGFLTLAQTPELAAEVTLQPLRRFALDAAILFSDILVVPEAIGMPYSFRDQGGIAMDWRLDSAADLDRLAPASALPERLAYVPAALRLIRASLGEDTALLGFSGSPWTLATYMIEGGSSDEFARAKALHRTDPACFGRLLELLTEAVVLHLQRQIEAGADAVQIFDSWGAACPGDRYHELSLRWIGAVRAALPKDVPVILYAKGMSHHAADLIATGADVLSLDWTVKLADFHAQWGDRVAVQGNLDPALLLTDPELVRAETRDLLDGMAGRPGHILNLGHGMLPQARVESVAALVDTATNR